MILDTTKLNRVQIIEFNKISIEIKNDFNKLTAQITNDIDQDIAWITGSLLSRNPYNSNLFEQLCLIEFIKRSIKQKPEITTIIVSNNPLKKVLTNYFKKQKKSIKIKKKQTLKQKLTNFLKPFLNLLEITFFIFQFLLNKKNKRKRSIPKNQELLLIDTFFIESMFKNNTYKDRYYPGLLNNLSTTETSTIYFTPQILIKKKLSKYLKIADNATENFIYKHDFLTLSDYFYALTTPMRRKKISLANYSFRNTTIAPLLKTDLKQNKFNPANILAILNYFFIKRLKQNQIKLQLVIDWFENQPIDKAFNLALKQFYPQTKTKGYLGFVVSFDYNFYLAPTKSEYNLNCLPDEINVIGKKLINLPLMFYNKLIINVAPAFRFQGVWNKNLQLTVIKKTILITLPIAIKESSEILNLINETVIKYKLNKINFHIKPHPALNIEQLKTKFTNLASNFHFVTGDFTQRLLETSFMIGNTSSTCLETIAIGLPVIVIGSQSGLTQNPIPENIKSDIWTLCYTTEELYKAINFYINQTPQKRQEYIEIGKEIRENYFEPVTPEGVKKFLELNSLNYCI